MRGGVSYFLWERSYTGNCRIISHSKDSSNISIRPLTEAGLDIFIRWNEAIGIYHKVRKDLTQTVSNIASAQRPFDLPTNVVGHDKKLKGDIMLIIKGGACKYYPKLKITKNVSLINKYKVLISKAYGANKFPHQVLNKPILGAPGTCCSETYIVFGPFANKDAAKNFISYVKTKFFRCLVAIKKISQDALQKVYSLVPLQDFSKPWTDEELYAKYGLTEEEIAFIESMIKPME